MANLFFKIGQKVVVRVINEKGVIKDVILAMENFTAEGLGKSVKGCWSNVKGAYFRREDGSKMPLDKFTFVDFMATGKVSKKVAEYRLWIQRGK